jgi:hypothetical protein
MKECVVGDEAHFDILRELVQSVEDVTYNAIRTVAFSSTEGLTESELRARIDLIRQLLQERDGARAILSDYLAGNQGADSAMRALETLARQTGFYDQGKEGGEVSQ